MVFSSIIFLFYFLAPVLLAHLYAPKPAKNVVLLIASLIFYSWGEPKYVLVMIFSILFNYGCGLWINSTQRRRTALVINIIVNIGILVYFKYTGFIVSWVSAFLPNGAPVFNIALPIGISFYTFQALSYTIDVYRKNTEVQKNPLSFGLYLSMFPQLIAGPIVKYSDVSRQLNHRSVTSSGFMEGFTRFCCGLCKKVIIANNVGRLFDMVTSMDLTGISMGLAWLGIFSFSMQLYFDFSGYSDMAIGLGRMFGFKFPENFRYPYASKSITEFWRRWHITLGSWFREYVYIPLGGNRVRPVRAYFNILVVWMLTGLWHGASWNFVLWGLYFAVLLIAEKLFLGRVLEKAGFFANIYAMLMVTLGWVLFSLDNITDIAHYLRSLFNFGYIGITENNFLYNLTSYGGVLFIAAIVSLGIPKKLYERFVPERFEWLKYIFAVCGFVICAAYLADESFNPFLYFRF